MYQIKYQIRKGTIRDKREVMDLYRAAIGSKGCSWSLDYPSEEHFMMDAENGNLFCMIGEQGNIIAAVSIDMDEEVNGLPCWSRKEGEYGELARVVVSTEYQGKGLAGVMVAYILKELTDRGVSHAYLLVSKNHDKAQHLYQKAGFLPVGECVLFETEWLCYEKPLV